MNKKVLLSGGTGLIGSALIDLLLSQGYQVAVLSRIKNKQKVNTFYWNYESNYIDKEAIEFADIIIHLAGENISKKRWSPKQKRIIIDSRVKTTRLIFEAVKTAKSKPITFISASAIGYYGTFKSEKILKENDSSGSDFLAETVVQWEKAADQFEKLAIRTVKLRIGVVLSKNGGALEQMSKPVKLGLGAALGNGKQYIPWVEITDLARLILYIIENDQLNSVYNAVSPGHVTNSQFMKTLAKKLKKPFFLPNIPAFIMKFIYGELSSIFLKGTRISSKKIQKEGFIFKYKELADVFDT